MDGCGITLLEDGICQLNKLEVLSLNFNDLDSLPEDMFKLESLQQLLLSYNNFVTPPGAVLNSTTRTSLLPSLKCVHLDANLIPEEEAPSGDWQAIRVSCIPFDYMQAPSLVVDREENGFEVLLGFDAPSQQLSQSY